MTDNTTASATPTPQSVTFRPMRRIRQQLPETEAVAILQQATAGVLSLNGDNGYPYGVPISYVYHDGHIYFHTATRGHKVDAIRSSDKATFTVISKDEVHPKEYTTYFRSVICFGRVRIVADEAEKLAATRLLGRRYSPDDEEGLAKEIAKAAKAMLIIDFTIEHITGKEAIELVRQHNRD